jgi:hypothetical protein
MKSFTPINMDNIHHGHKSYENIMIFCFYFHKYCKNITNFLLEKHEVMLMEKK